MGVLRPLKNPNLGFSRFTKKNPQVRRNLGLKIGNNKFWGALG
jgi:hypothetical protein